jgi:hypothetical protein
MSAVVSTIAKVFPKALPNHELVAKVSQTLSTKGFTPANTLLACALCCDELSRPLEKEFQSPYGQNFSMGGLAGFAFGGVTSFGAMAAHIPDGGNCLVVYGPHVGVDNQGKVGTVERVGRLHGGACCGSACAACNAVLAARSGGAITASDTVAVVDKQQALVTELLAPYSDRLAAADDVMAELPKALYDAQTELMMDIISKGAGNVSNGMIGVVGGVQINTPPELSDYFWAQKFEVFDNKGVKQDEFEL